MSLPTVFTDDDGTIVDTDWWFDENVNLDGGVVTLSSPFTENYTDIANPLVAWATPGWKNITIFATDDAGNVSVATLHVEVLNQRPVAIFPRPADGTTNTMYTFLSSSFDPDGNSGEHDPQLDHHWNRTKHVEQPSQSHVYGTRRLQRDLSRDR